MTPPGGEWNLSFQSAIWTITVDDVRAGSAISRGSEIEAALERVNGQTLAAVDWTQNSSLIASFAEGARMEAFSDRTEPDAIMWWLVQVNGNKLSMDGRGLLDFKDGVARIGSS